MKIFATLTISLIGISYLSNAQLNVVYPLQIGNLWRYQDFVIGNFEFRQTLRDSVAPNGRTYVAIHDEWRGGRLQRTSGDSVLEYDPYYGQERLIADFSRSVGDTIATYINGFDTTDMILLNYRISNLFGLNCRQWDFLTNPRHFVDAGIVETITDSIGLTTYTSFSEQKNITGAIVNGKQYGTIVSVNGPIQFPSSEYRLHQNYPNPFNSTTEIRYQVSDTRMITLEVFDVLGKEVATLVHEIKSPGTYKVSWEATGFPTGIYFYRLRAGNFIDTKKLILLK